MDVIGSQKLRCCACRLTPKLKDARKEAIYNWCDAIDEVSSACRADHIYIFIVDCSCYSLVRRKDLANFDREEGGVSLWLTDGRFVVLILL